MTSVIPSSEATVQVQPFIQAPVLTATPGTILDYLVKFKPWFARLIKKANMSARYNSCQTRVTLFLPLEDPSLLLDKISSDEARHVLNTCTIPGLINVRILKASPRLQLYPYAYPHESLNVQLFSDQSITINGLLLVAGDIKCANGMIHLLNNMLVPQQA